MKNLITISTLNKTLGIFILVANVLIIYYIGLLIMLSPITLLVNMGIIPAIMGIIKSKNKAVLVLNILVSIYTIFYILYFINLAQYINT